MSDVRAPTGFQLGLPEGWEIFDLVEPTVFRLGLSDTPLHLAHAHWRLADIEHATGGEQIRARLQPAGAGAQTECVLSAYATDVVNDADDLMAALANDQDDTDQVPLPVGKSVRRTGRRSASREMPARFVHQFFIPVPGTDNEIVLLELWSSSFDAESVLRPQFEGIASSLEFTYDAAPDLLFGDGDGDSITVMSAPSVRQLVRSTFAGWPRRFSMPSHLAVAAWLLAALVIAGRVVLDADKGFVAILDDIVGGGFIAFFGVFGYVLDQSRDRTVHLFWLALGAFLAWVAITCPDGRLGHLC